MKTSNLFIPFLFCVLAWIPEASLYASEGNRGDDGWSWSLSEGAETALRSSCPIPGGLHVTDITSTSVTIIWNQVYEAESYSVQFRVYNGYWEYVPGGPFMVEWVTLYGLNPGTTYEVRVRANCGYGEQSNWSYPVSFTTSGGSSCPKPGGLWVSDITSTSAKVHWNPVYEAQSYTVQYRTYNGYWEDVPGGPFMQEWVTIYGLYPGTTYEVRVRANCGYGQQSHWSYPVSFTTSGGSSCEPPDWLGTLHITQTTATFDWSSVYGADSYTIQWRYPGGSWHTLVSSWPYSSVDVIGLHPATTYEWRVKSHCGYGDHSDWSYIVTFTTQGNTCHAPTYLTTTHITGNSATLNWSAVTGAQNYSVQIRSSYGTWYTIPGSPFTGTMATVYSLDPGTTYQWRVRANCGYGNQSDWSYSETFTTDGSASCEIPGGLHTYQITATSAVWDWAPAPGAISYSVQWRYPGGNWYDLHGGPWTQTALHIGGLQPGTTYEWRVRSNCYYGHSDWSAPDIFTTQGTVCHQPVDLITVQVTGSSATFAWSPVPGAVSYSVQLRLPGGYWTYIPGSPFTDNTATVYNLSPGITYAWRVRANCGYGLHSYWSSIEYFTTEGTSACPPPDSMYATNISEHMATLNWTEVPGAWYYIVQWRIPGGPWHTIYTPWFFILYHLGDLEPNTTYEWRVRAKCGNGMESAWTDIGTFTTEDASALANDHCFEAQILTVGDTCNTVTVSNETATASFPPPQGDCGSDNYQDVWFMFTMPDGNYPAATIRTLAGTLTDAVMEIYIGQSCLNLAFLLCEDDNQNGNGSAMPVVNLLGGAGIPVWVRVWGKNGAEGTFDICVLNHLSDNLNGEVTTLVLPELPGRVEEQTGTELKAVEDGSLPAFAMTPNPASTYVQISHADQAMVTGLALMDMTGRVMLKKAYDSSDHIEFQEQIDVSDLAVGTYVLQLLTTAGLISEKILIVH